MSKVPVSSYLVFNATNIQEMFNIKVLFWNLFFTKWHEFCFFFLECEFFLHFESIFLPKYLEFKNKPLSLQCVFHSIRFKVNKVGCRRAPFFRFMPLLMLNLLKNWRKILRANHLNDRFLALAAPKVIFFVYFCTSTERL